MTFGAVASDEILRLLALVPVFECLARLIQLVQNDQVLNIVAKVLRPSDNAFHAARVRCHHADARHLNSLGCQLRINVGEPLIGDSSAACSHVGENDVALRIRA